MSWTILRSWFKFCSVLFSPYYIHQPTLGSTQGSKDENVQYYSTKGIGVLPVVVPTGRSTECIWRDDVSNESQFPVTTCETHGIVDPLKFCLWALGQNYRVIICLEDIDQEDDVNLVSQFWKQFEFIPHKFSNDYRSYLLVHIWSHGSTIQSF